MRFIFVSLLVFICFSVKSQTVRMIFAGDVMGHGPQVRAAYDSSHDSYDYNPCFQFIKPIIQNADIAVANLEVVLGGKPFTGYPVFSSPDELAIALKNTGFDILVNANNHCYDKGKFGFERTIATLDSLSIPHLGTYLNPQTRDSLHPLIIEKNGLRIALLNYTYGTNGIVPESPNMVNYIDREKMSLEIGKAKAQHVDFIIAVLHWGLEYMLTPNKEQEELAQFLASKGCDAVIGSHPHVVQTFEIVYPNPNDSAVKVPVFYSLGNLVSNQRNRYRNGGALYGITLWKDNTQKAVINYSYTPYWVYKGLLFNTYQYYVMPLSIAKLPEYYNQFPTNDKDSLNQFSNDIKGQLPNLNMDTTLYIK